MLKRKTQFIGIYFILAFALLTTAIVYFKTDSLNNQYSSLVDDEITYLESKIDTLQVLFMQDKINSSLRPSQHLEDLSIFNKKIFVLVPWSYTVWSKGLSRSEFLNRVDILIITLAALDVNQNVKDELNIIGLKYVNQELVHNVAYLELKRFELSVLLDLYIKQNVYKEITNK